MRQIDKKHPVGLWARLVAIIIPVLAASPGVADPLPSWADTAAKMRIIDFVERVTTAGSDDYVPESLRIAAFDNDGTLWTERPLPPQAYYALDRVEALVKHEPALKDDPDVSALLAGDMAALAGDNYRGLLHIMQLTHAGMPMEEFHASVELWMRSAKHPRFDRLFTDTTFQPSLELLHYLRDHGFKTFISSGGGLDFMRVWSERVYGIPPEQVIGSHGQPQFRMVDGKPVLTKGLEPLFVNDGDGKAVGIAQFIGRRPVLIVGNSDGDKAMLSLATIDNPLPSLGILIHHTDAEREYRYGDNSGGAGAGVSGALQAAREHNWLVVDMKSDWRKVFAFDE